jgi:signal transduction histidine kinase
VSPIRRLLAIPGRLHAVLGAPGVIIGLLSLLSFGFGLVVLVDEYHHPTQTGRKALLRIIGGWIHLDDYLGYTLVDYADRWRTASPEDRPRALGRLSRALSQLGGELSSHDAQLRLIRVTALDIGPGGGPSLSSWRPVSGTIAGGEETTEHVRVTDGDGRGPSIELTVKYQVVPEIAAAVADVENSYHRLLLALLGLSGYSLLCLGYMVLYARAQRERIAREAAAAATLDLADRTCHELGNVAFVVANERRNLSSHIELLERFVAEDSDAHTAAARRAGLDPVTASRFENALRREYADRGIDPEFELRGSASIARDVCRQIAVCSDYIALTVRELDGYLKRSTIPAAPVPIALGECLDDALALLAPRLEATESRVERPSADGPSPSVLADRRLLIHALVNLIKNAVEAATSAGRSPVIRLSVRLEGETAWLSVADNGPGIPPGELRRIFEAGYSTKGTGRGLGLAIVRESISAQGGSLDVESQPGSGTEFRVGLKLS